MKKLVHGKSVEVAPAPLPYDWMTVSAPASDGCHVYLIDRDGRKIGAIWGKAGEKISTVKLIVERCNGAQVL